MEKIAELNSLLKKRSGSALPATHQVMLDLKIELANLYDACADSKLEMESLNKRFEIVRERVNLIENLEGQETDSRMKGFLLFRTHTLLVAKLAAQTRSKTLKEQEMKEIAPQLANSLTESARILLHDYGCPNKLLEIISRFQ